MGDDPPARSNGGRIKLARPELEFYLLSIVHNDPLPLWTLNPRRFGEVVDRCPSDFTREELIEILSDMFRAGDLIARRYSRTGRGQWFLPAPSEIDSALCGALNLEYGLTAQGGARWEAMSDFDWNYHLGGFDEDGFGCPSRETIETYLSWIRWSCLGSHVIPVPGTEEWSVERPWKATYWKELPVGIRVRYKEAPDERSTTHFALIGDLWSGEWNQHRQDEMLRFVPMEPRRTKAIPDTRWRIRLSNVAQQRLDELPALLEAADPALQYAAALRLAESSDYTTILLEWFLKRKTRYALRVVSSICTPQVLDALVEAFRINPWGDTFPYRDGACGSDLGRAIGAFGEAAVSRLAPLLTAESAKMQVEVLAALGETSSETAGAIILSWLDTLDPDHSREHSWRVEQALLALAKLRDLRALPVLAHVLEHEPMWATKPLILFDHPNAWAILEDFIRSEARLSDRSRVAGQMARANGGYRNESERLSREYESEHVCFATTWLVTGDCHAEIHEPVAALIDVLSNSDPERRVTAITLISRHEQPFPTKNIAVLLNDPVAEVRANAVYAIGLRGSTSALSAVEASVADPSGLVRYCAREALRRLRSSTSP